MMKNVNGKKVTILGAARSGIAAAEMLKALGARPFVSDSASEADKEEQVHRLQKTGIAYEFGGHSAAVYEADFAVLSPGIPVRSKIVQSFFEKKIPVYSEIEVASWFCKGGLIAVTGSNGKTTTTTLIGEMLREKYPQAAAAGNIGSPFSAAVLQTTDESWTVVEVSSFQLETIETFHPNQAVVLNFAPNHLDRYDDYDAYLAAKWRVVKNISAKDYLIYNAADARLSRQTEEKEARKMGFDINGDRIQAAWFDGQSIFLHGEELINVQEMKLRGKHNYMNAMAAALAAQNAGVAIEAIRTVLQNFAGVEHRLEFCAEKNGVKFINDSKATTVESLSFALQSFDTPIVLIAGGKDKGSDFTKLNDLIKRYVKTVVLIGTAAEKMEQAWQGIKPLKRAETLEEAVQMAAGLADKGEVVLLSPACASFDMFTDFEDRGRQFKKIVHHLTD